MRIVVLLVSLGLAGGACAHPASADRHPAPRSGCVFERAAPGSSDPAELRCRILDEPALARAETDGGTIAFSGPRPSPGLAVTEGESRSASAWRSPLTLRIALPPARAEPADPPVFETAMVAPVASRSKAATTQVVEGAPRTSRVARRPLRPAP